MLCAARSSLPSAASTLSHGLFLAVGGLHFSWLSQLRKLLITADWQVAWDVKAQLQALRRSRTHRRWLEFRDPLIDVRIAAWLHKPDSTTTVCA